MVVIGIAALAAAALAIMVPDRPSRDEDLVHARRVQGELLRSLRVPCVDANVLMVRVVYPNGSVEETDYRDTICGLANFTVAVTDGRLFLFAEDAAADAAVFAAVEDGMRSTAEDMDQLWWGLVSLYNGRVQARGFPMRRIPSDVIEIWADDRVIAEVDCRRHPCMRHR